MANIVAKSFIVINFLIPCSLKALLVSPQVIKVLMVSFRYLTIAPKLEAVLLRWTFSHIVLMRDFCSLSGV